MTWSYTDGGFNTGQSTAATTGTHGYTINENDLVVIYVNIEGTATITADEAGWTNPVDEQPSGISYKHAVFWKKAGASEPSAYGFTIGSSSRWRVSIKVFSSTEGDFEVDAAANTHLQTATQNDLLAGAADGEVISDDAVSIICAAKGSRSTSSEEYTVADNNYDTDTDAAFGGLLQCIGGMAHYIYGTGTTFSGDITIETADGNDARTIVTYSAHISFTEVTGGGTSINYMYYETLLSGGHL